MRLVKNKVELNGSGTVTLCPEEPEDMVRMPPPPHLLATFPNLLCLMRV